MGIGRCVEERGGGSKGGGERVYLLNGNWGWSTQGDWLSLEAIFKYPVSGV